MMISRVALEVINALDEERLEFVRRKGTNIIKKLSEIRSKRALAAHGRGFMIGVDLVDENGKPDGKYALKVREKLAHEGVICSLTGEHNNVLKITPPVLIDEETLNEGINKIISVLGNN